MGVIRAAGLSSMTPQTELDRCLGTSLENFAISGILINGLKILQIDERPSDEIFDRSSKIRPHKFPRFFIKKTFMREFFLCWNELDKKTRKSLQNAKSMKQRKTILKIKRKLKNDPEIHV